MSAPTSGLKSLERQALLALAVCLGLGTAGWGQDHAHHEKPVHGPTRPEHSHRPAAPAPAAASHPREPIPVLTPADRAAAFPEIEAGHPVHDQAIVQLLQLNRFEGWRGDDGADFEWEGHYWRGADLHKLWLRSQGEHIDDRTTAADLEILYARSIAPWWELVAGARHDFHPRPARTFAAVGLQGLAPYKFEVEATAYFGESGQSAARLEAEYELLLTNRLILQPQLELNAYGKKDTRRAIGAGFSTLEAGLRLRYEFTRRFAPYVGLAHERALADTADLRRAAGEDASDTQLVVGLRLWF